MVRIRMLGVTIFAVAALAATVAQAASGGGPFEFDVRDAASEEIRAIHQEIVRRAAELGAPVTTAVPTAAATQFQYPLVLAPQAGGFVDVAISNHTDRNPAAVR